LTRWGAVSLSRRTPLHGVIIFHHFCSNYR
jgi:hypothetical protein